MNPLVKRALERLEEAVRKARRCRECDADLIEAARDLLDELKREREK